MTLYLEMSNSTTLFLSCVKYNGAEMQWKHYLQIVEWFHFHDGAACAERQTDINGLIGAQRSQNLQRASRGQTKTIEKKAEKHRETNVTFFILYNLHNDSRHH